jgi:phage-related holin
MVPFAITVIFMIMDYGTGIANAIMHNQMSSEKMRNGLWHKFAYIVVTCTAILIEWGAQWLDLGFDIPLVAPVLTSIALIEITSILENCVKINPELKAYKVLNIFSKSQDEKTDK